MQVGDCESILQHIFQCTSFQRKSVPQNILQEREIFDRALELTVKDVGILTTILKGVVFEQQEKYKEKKFRFTTQ